MQLRRFYRRQLPKQETKRFPVRLSMVKKRDWVTKPARTLIGSHPLQCFYCGRSPKESGQPLTVVHVVPQSQGGASDMGNKVLACYRCNMRKGSMTIQAFQGLLREERVAPLQVEAL